MVGFSFPETNIATSEITRLFDFVWPTAIALWNLRWQVDGFLNAVPNATYEDVASRFVVGSDIHGADIRAMHTNTTWIDQKARFSEFILTNAFAIYESWARSMIASSNISTMSDRNLYQEGDGVSSGLSVFISQINASPSSVMTASFKPQFLKHKKVFIPQQGNMLKCYKYFKELRNCHIHNGGKADQRLLDSYNNFHLVSSPSAMHTKERIEYYPVTLGEKTELSLRGVVGFCDIILRLMITIDAQISGSKAAEVSILSQVKKCNSPVRLTLNSDKNRAIGQINKLCRNANLPKPLMTEMVSKLFIDNGLVSR